jgi:large subunit ribosomal protein L4
MPGGAVVFGPRPRKYDFDLPRKFKQLGLRSALSYLYAEGKLSVVSDMKSAEGKTKVLANQLKQLGVEKAVLIDGETDAVFARASRNMPKVRYYSTDGLNVYDLLKYDRAIITKASLEGINARCGVGK